MRTFKVVPDQEGWSGYVVLKNISYDDKWDYLEENGDISKLEGKEQMKAIRGMVNTSEKYFLEVNLTHEDGTKVSSFQEMKEITEFHNWLMSLAMRVFNGNVGNV